MGEKSLKESWVMDCFSQGDFCNKFDEWLCEEFWDVLESEIRVIKGLEEVEVEEEEINS
jgi:hypothetical protein